MNARLSAGRLAFAFTAFLQFCAVAAAQSEPAAVQGILRVIPPDVHAAFIVPNLKHASGDHTRLLEGMDRANLLLGLRPIDQFKSVTGFIVGLDDHGSAAIVVVDAGNPAEHRPARTVTIVPVTNAQEFIEGNLLEVVEGEPDARERADGLVVYVKALSAHVIMGEDMQTVRGYSERDGFERVLNNAAGERAAILTAGEFGVIIRQPAIAAMKQSLLRQAEQANVMLPGVAVLAQEIADDVDLLAMSIDCDPLAVIVRSFVRFRDEADFGKLAPAQPPAGRSLSRLPSKPYAMALSVNLAALGGEGMLHGATQAIGDPPNALPEWMTKTTAFDFAIAPSPAGAAGGLLNEAMLVLASDDPAAVRESIKRDVLSLQNNPTITREAKWSDDQPLSSASNELTADAWEVRTVSVPPELAQIEVIERFLFGTAGMRGYVRQEPRTVLMTFSQRPAVLEALTQSVRQVSALSAPPDAGFGGSATIRTMRKWMPAQRVIEVYLHAAAARQMLAPFFAGAGVLPEFSAGLPPIGAAMDVSPQRTDATVIVPAGVLAPLFDELTRRVPLREQPVPE